MVVKLQSQYFKKYLNLGRCDFLKMELIRLCKELDHYWLSWKRRSSNSLHQYLAERRQTCVSLVGLDEHLVWEENFRKVVALHDYIVLVNDVYDGHVLAEVFASVHKCHGTDFVLDPILPILFAADLAEVALAVAITANFLVEKVVN